MLKSLLLALIIFINGCGEVGGSGQCGGVATAGACIMISNIAPSYFGETTSNVDIVPNLCVDPATGATTGVEQYGDHFASISFLNFPLPGAIIETMPIVTIQNYSISYTLNECPTGATCPALDTSLFNPGDSFTIFPDADPKIPTGITKDLSFFSIRKKDEFISKGGTTNSYPSYSANYIFNGTTTFNQSISVSGSVEFTLGDFNNC